MTIKPRLEILQTSLQYSGRLGVPSVSLVNNTRVADQLLAKLGPYGAQLDSLWHTVSPQNLASSSFTMTFLGGYATLQLAPHGVELSFRGPGDAHPNVPLIIPEAVLSEIITQVGTAVGLMSEQPHFATHTFTLSFHARLHGESLGNLLDSYVGAAPQVFGELERAGVQYVFKPAGARQGSWLVAEPSASITPNGLYVSCSVEFDGAQIGIEIAAQAAREYVKSIVESPDCPVRIGNE